MVKQRADKAANWNLKTAWHNWSIAAKWLRTRHLERTKRAFPYEGLERRAALVKAVSGKPWEGWTSTGALLPTGCPCADCVNKDPPRADSFHLGSPSDQYVIQLHAQHQFCLQAEMEPSSDVQTSSSSPPPPPSSSSGKGASALPAVHEEESDEDQTWGIWSGLPAPLTPKEESDEDQAWGTWTGHGHS